MSFARFSHAKYRPYKVEEVIMSITLEKNMPI